MHTNSHFICKLILVFDRVVMDLLWEKGLEYYFWKNLSMLRYHENPLST